MPLADRPPALRLHARPALAVAAALGLGVALESAWSPGLAAWALGLAAAAALPVGVAVATRGRLVTPRPLARAVAAVVAAVTLGGARQAAWDAPAPDHVGPLARASEAADSAGADASLRLWARVAEPPVAVASGVRVRLAADSARRGPHARRLRGLVETTLARPRYGGRPPPPYPALHLGDRVRLDGTLRPPPRPRNPADFDYGAYLRRQGVGATLRVTEAGAVERLGPTRDPLVALVARVQAHTRRAVARFVRGARAQAVLVALLVADRSGIDPETQAAFRETGLTHLLAVSGLHVLLVGLVLYTLLRPTLARLGLGWRAVEAVRAGITLAVLGVYALVTGGSPSVVRAVVMAGAMVAGRTLQRPTDALNGLGLAAVGLLLWRPTALFDVGFQLSYAAVAAMVLLAPVLALAVPDGWTTRRAPRAAVQGLVASLSATLGTAPVLLYHFGQLPLGGLVLNLPAIPVANAALGAGLGVALTAGPAPWMADAFAAGAEVSTALLLAITEAGADGLGWTLVEGFVTGLGAAGALVLGLFALAAWRTPRTRWRTTVAAVACAAAGVWAAVLAGDARPRVDALFLDVGQGDAALLALPGGRHLLVDAGPADEAWDAGARTVVPHLRRMGVRRLDAVVVSHPHLDHFGGLAAVLRAVPVGRVLVNGQPGEHPLWRRALGVADSLGVPVRAVRAGDTLDLGPAVRAHVLAPTGPPAPSTDGGTINDGSVVLRLAYGRTAFVFTGDAEERGEAELAARYGPLLAADVVKVGHHGSRTSSTPAFVDAASARGGAARWAVVSVARRNRYGLPDEEPLARWAEAGARVALTSSEGAVWLRSDGRRVERMEWRTRTD